MKIATWNIERLKHRSASAEMLDLCERIRADILVLTETDRRFRPSLPYAFHTPPLSEYRIDEYRPTENRVSIYTRYPCTAQYETCDSRTALCVELNTSRGPLIVYGTIIGIYGNRHPTFQQDLVRQLDDLTGLAALNKPMCICGDYNCSFGDNYYFTHDARHRLNTFFTEHHLRLVTSRVPACIDHIAISEHLLCGSAPQLEEWNTDRRLSDHKGIAVRL